MELIRHRGDYPQAQVLERWLEQVLDDYGPLRVPDPHNAIDKLIAAIALLHDLTVVTRNADDFAGTGVRVLNSFSAV